MSTSGFQRSQNKICASPPPLYHTLVMNTEEIAALAEQLDWNCDPNPSPYQWRAWRKLLTLTAEQALPMLRDMEARMRSYKGFFPYSYARAFERCKATNTSNL